MIIGSPSSFAVESQITLAYADLGLRALGFFVVHIGGTCYGARESDATMLACAFDEVGRIISDRGKHTIPFSNEPVAGKVVEAIRQAVYEPVPTAKRFFGLSILEISNYVFSSRCEWHRACDEAFDDGSYILRFDVGRRVRLIADRPMQEKAGNRGNTETFSDTWLEADEYYGVLRRWHTTFETEWDACVNKL